MLTMLVVFTNHYDKPTWHEGNWTGGLWDSEVVISPPLKLHRWWCPTSSQSSQFMPQNPDSSFLINKPVLSVCLSVLTHTIPSWSGSLWHTIYSRGWGRRWGATLVLWDISGWHFGLSPACLQSCILKCYHFRQILQGSANTVSNILLQRLFHIFCHCCSVTPSATWQAADSSRDIR